MPRDSPATSTRRRPAGCAARRPGRGPHVSRLARRRRGPRSKARDARRRCRTGCARHRRCSPAPAGCTRRAVRPRTASCSSCARTSAGTTPSTRSSAGPSRGLLPLRGHRPAGQRARLVRARAEGGDGGHPGAGGGVGAVVARRRPGRQAGLTLVGFLRGESMNVYTRPDRIKRQRFRCGRLRSGQLTTPKSRGLPAISTRSPHNLQARVPRGRR